MSAKKIKNRKRKTSSNLSQNGKIQKTDSNQGAGNIDDGVEDEMIATEDTQDQEEVEEVLKTSGSFNMKKFREKLKSGDFITVEDEKPAAKTAVQKPIPPKAPTNSKKDSSDSDSDSDDEPPAKKVAVTPKPAAKAAPQKKTSDSLDSDSSEEETEKPVAKAAVKPAAAPPKKIAAKKDNKVNN